MHLALLVGTIVALLLASFVLLVHFNSFFRIKTIKSSNLIEDVNQHVFEVLNDSKLQIGDTLRVEKNNTIRKTYLSFHGCWQKIYSESVDFKTYFSKTLFVGSKITLSTPNLYLKNSNSPLVLVGNTTLKGNVFLPKQGVKAGTIAGNYFQNSQLVFGKTSFSQSELPKLDSQWISYVKSLYSNALMQENELNNLSLEMKNSFKDKAKIVYKASPISLNQGEIHGNIILKSATSITVNAGVSLIDVILIAPRIDIRSNVKGTFQAFAQKQIKVGDNCKLNFPSALVLYKKETTEEIKNTESPIEIGVNSRVEGSVVFLREKNKINKRFRRGIKTHLKIKENVFVSGEVYCQGNMELLGTINGSCYTERFVANQFSSKYINHIYNGEIKPFLVKPYSGLSFEGRRIKEKSIAKWLY